MEDSSDDSGDEFEGKKTLQESAVDITEKFIKDRLDPMLVTELVMRSLPKLPSEIPPHFSSSYTPIDAAGTEGQIKHVSRLLAAQMTAVGIGPGVREVNQKKIPLPRIESDEDDEEKELEVTDEFYTTFICFVFTLDLLKFIYSEKATKFCEIFTLLLFFLQILC